MRRRSSFLLKIFLLISALIIVTSVCLTTVSAYRVRRTLYQHEFQGAHTVYLALVNYLAGHYKSHSERFIYQSLSFVLEDKFLKDETADSEMAPISISSIALYSAFGRLIFQHPAQSSEPPPERLAEQDWPRAYRNYYDAELKSVVAAGPVSASGEVPGYVVIRMPSDIEAEVRALFVRSFIVMGGVLVFALGLAAVFARRALRPIEALTRAAQRVHEGDLNQRVVPQSSDEIGLLATAFNDMTGSLSHRLALMHRTQEWGLRISREFDMKKLNEILLDMFEDMAPTGICRLYTTDSKTGQLALAAYRGTEATISLRGDELTRLAMESSAPCGMDEGGRVLGRTASAAEIAIPLSTANQCLGVVRLGRRSDHKLYDDEAVTTLQTLVQDAAMSIENARLYQELASRQRFEQEMEWAREIQAMLMPQRTPDLNGYEIFGASRPAFEVGGDYFDYVQADGNQWHLVIGDVSGKGVPAALIMNVVRSLIHSFAEFEEAPGPLIARVNKALLPDLEPEMFVTVADLKLDPREHKVRMIRAGHEPILLLRKSGETKWMEPPGAALGMLSPGDFDGGLRESVVSMDPGDLLVLYTDGITETVNGSGEEFGYQGIESALRSRMDLALNELAEVLIREIQAFGGGQPQRDDITLIMLRRKS